jgi:glycosyltransferase involved in cell wall biosynthesis
MYKTITLNDNYSTTKRVIKADPEIISGLVKQSNKPEDKFEKVLFLPLGEGRQGEGGLRTKGYFKVGGIIPSPKAKPLITVITVVFNGEKFLEETILSVINQNYDNIEYIIVDGGSTDKSIEIIKKYNHAIDYWVSERDNGMYHAINKGISCAQGELLNFLNSDDLFDSPKTVQTVVKTYNAEKFECLYGRSKHINSDGKILFLKKPLSYKKRYLKTLGLYFTQPTFFWKYDLMHQTGTINTNYEIAADYDFISSLLKYSKSNYRTKEYIAKFRHTGESFGDNNSFKAKEEFEIIRKQFHCNFYLFFSIYDRLLQLIVSKFT